ncbi:EAL domain-containing protein [Variovorax ginsengisoli]|uniref:Diguanylate cyclase (GGDEF)-like protein/PAS domain S-box-containing protein n=1 Tax=Variovorax ginsengisoli TaxID=363844 RepID=A0ABT9S3W9_9BURK|nr:EAL domain-containing protein [Variovorax ginsengisoli]MDP9899035.1 diguanylate cyclase (GGDEF)-like protein/PAS domain S-box-containing protein [Variovorax ginsengisoli]
MMIVLVVGLPLTYFSVCYGSAAAALQTKAAFRGEVITQAINRAPQMWRFDEHRLQELLVRLPMEPADERAAIVSDEGETIVASRSAVAWPVMSRSVPLFEAGVPVGRVVVQRSLRGLLMESGIAALLGLVVAAVVLTALRQLLAKYRSIVSAMYDEQERARVTLQSIGDAVITIDANERVEYLNPMAERLTQWTLAEARGKLLNEVCALADESTMQAIAPRVKQAMREGRFCAFSGQDVALFRRDGSSLAIEESAAPIRSEGGDVTGGVMVFRDVSGMRRMAQRISWAATHDALTGLINRAEFEIRVDAALLSLQTLGQPHALCHLDLDKFKIINDTCGYAAGDALLKQMADLLQENLFSSCSVARLGGDEFGILFEGRTVEQAKLIIEDLLALLSRHRFRWDGRDLSVSASAGLVGVSADTGTRSDAFNAADTACEFAKQQGRNRVCVYRHSDRDLTKHRSEVHWAARLASAVEEKRLVLYYQPYANLRSDKFERRHIQILLRLLDENGEVTDTETFLPAAERYNLMPSLDRWVIGAVFSRYRELAVMLGEPLTCCIKLSGTTLNSDGMFKFLRDLSLRHELPQGALSFEITEKAAINNMLKATQFMGAVRSLGFTFALNDFGIGSSSLAYLKKLPVDYLKIDGSLVRNMVHDRADRTMVETINRVGHLMGFQTIAEHAESDDVVRQLRAIGVDYAQGEAVQSPSPLTSSLSLSAIQPGATSIGDTQGIF